MRGCLFIIALGALVLAVVVTVGLPAAASGVVTAGLAAGGLRADDLRVEVTSDPPTELLGLRADRVRIRATDATFRDIAIERLDIVLDDMDLGTRQAAVVDGRIDGLVLDDIGGAPVRLDSLRLTGGGEAVLATTTLGVAITVELLADALERSLGIRPTSVRIGPPDRVVIAMGSLVSEGAFTVTPAGDLVIRVASGPGAGDDVPVLRAGSDLPMRLTHASVDATGLRLTGVLTIGLLG